MAYYDSQPQETPGRDWNPARIVLQSGDRFDVAHHFIREGGAWVCAYETERDGGIDYRFSTDAVAYIDTSPTAQSPRGDGR